MKKLLTMIGAAFAVAVGAMMPLAAQSAAALSVAVSGDDVSVTVEAGVLDSASEIYLVWDGQDHGENLLAWPEAKRLKYDGAVTSAAATYVLDKSSVPDGDVMRVIVPTGLYLLDYIILGDSNYIDTGVKDTAAYGATMKLRSKKNTWTVTSSYPALIGAERGNFHMQQNGKTAYTTLTYNCKGGKSGTITISDNWAAAHTIVFDNNGHWLDGVQSAWPSSSAASLGNKDKNIFIGNNYSGSSLQNPPLKVEWYYLQLDDNSGNALKEFHPAVYTNSSDEAVYAMYDKISGGKVDVTITGTAIDQSSSTVTGVVAKAVSPVLATCTTAYWTGGGDVANVNDPANWAVTNVYGVEVANGVPDADTRVVISGATAFSVPIGQTLSCRKLSIGNVTLSADCDWRGLTIPASPDYIDASQYAYIDTGLKPGSGTHVEMKVTVRSNKDYFFGASNADYKNNAYALANDGASLYCGFWDGGGTGTNGPIANGLHTIDFNNGVVMVDGEKWAERNNLDGKTFASSRNLYLFAGNFGNGLNTKAATVRCHYCKIWQDDTLVRDFVPTNNGTAFGLCDRLTGTFYGNQGDGTIEGETGSFTIDGTVDLAGCSLLLADMAGSGTVTDSVGGGELHIDICADRSVANTTLGLAGALKLVKEGPGTFTASKTVQTYTGGTEVAGGLFKAGANHDTGILGGGSMAVTVDSSAIYDINGKAQINGVGFALNGGSLANTGSDINNYTASLKAVSILDDSAFDVAKSFGFIVASERASLDLGGKTLTFNIADGKGFWMRNTSVTAGTIELVGTGNGAFNFGTAVSDDSGRRYYTAATNTNFRVNSALKVCEPSDIGDYEAIFEPSNAGYNDTDNVGYSALRVHGTFKPSAHNYFYGATIMDGATIDLSARTTALNLVSAFTSGDNTLKFEDGATVYINVGERKCLSSTPLISWTTAPDNIDGIQFKMYVGGSLRCMNVKDDGVYPPANGFIIMVL